MLAIHSILPARHATKQTGAVAIIVALSIVVLVGFAGLVLDLGRLYVNKSELQTAADACALAAAAELTCDTGVSGACTTSYLQNAENAGVTTAARNRRDFQGDAVSISRDDVKFYTALAQTIPLDQDSNYLSLSGGADTTSKFAMCTARTTGIAPWFMGLLGQGPSDVSATAVATLAPSQSFCSALPVGICRKSASSCPDGSTPVFGYCTNDWIESAFNSGGNGDSLTGNFRWIDFTPNAGGTSEIRDQLATRDPVCNIRIGDNVEQAGVHQGAKTAYNTRFGIYPNGGGPNAYTPTTAPPDRTGYAYPNKAPGDPVISINQSGALAAFQTAQSANAPFDKNEYDDALAGGKVNGNAASSSQLHDYGGERRLNAVPIIDCNAGNTVTILGMGCVLMLNPMANGANGKIFLEYVNPATVPNSPCRTSGQPGGGGPLVPMLVQ